MNDFSKTVRIGIDADTGSSVFCKIKWIDNRLSITGVVGPQRNGSAKGSCGQIVDSFVISTYADGWTPELLEQFRKAWNRWHLNDMKAGSPAQSDYLRANPVEYSYPVSHYDAELVALEAAGLNPDPNYLHNGKPYHYGHAWLNEDVPDGALIFLKSLPDTDKVPAWV